ncbi:MAG TPA: PGPGW domain-containing protein [Candidatus Binataceae bacterium]|nr:PGPGW domain-containing protein [Candidatus Binataceae bacterium]
MKTKITGQLKNGKRIAVFAAGCIVLLLGVIMLVVPGPGILTIALGLGILATEFPWAKRILKYMREKGTRIIDLLFRRHAGRAINGAQPPQPYQPPACHACDTDQ